MKLAIEMEEYKQKAYSDFGNSDEMKAAIATITGISGIQGRDFFAAQPDITVAGKNINLLKAYEEGDLVFGGYADTKTKEFLSPDGELLKIMRPNLPVYMIKIGDTYYLKQFELDGPE